MATPKRLVDRRVQQGRKTRPPDSKPVRTTLMIQENVDKAVEICAAHEGKQKSAVVNEALTTYLKKRGHL